MGAFSNGRPVSAGGSGQPPPRPPPAWHAQLEKMQTNPLLSGSQPGLPLRGGSSGFGGGSGAPITGYGALATGQSRAGLGGASDPRGDGYWGAKPPAFIRSGGGGGGSSGMYGTGSPLDVNANKRKYSDVWAPSGATGKVGKQPKPPGKSPNSSKPPAKAPGAHDARFGYTGKHVTTKSREQMDIEAHAGVTSSLELAKLTWVLFFGRMPEDGHESVKYGTHPEGTKLAKTICPFHCATQTDRAQCGGRASLRLPRLTPVTRYSLRGRSGKPPK